MNIMKYKMKSKLIILFCLIIALLSIGFRQCDEIRNPFNNAYSFLVWLIFVGPGDQSGKITPNYIGISVGESGRINRAGNGPTSQWIQMQSPTTKYLHFVKAYSDSNTSLAYAVGDSGAVIGASDSLTNWFDRSIPNLNKNLWGLDFFVAGVNDVRLVVCGDSGTVYKSSNSGGNWTWHKLNTITTKKLKSIVALSPSIFVAAGDSGTIIRTDDGGLTWVNINVIFNGSNVNRIFKGIEVGAPSNLWLAGNNGTIYKSTSYGSSWFSLSSGTTKNLYDIKFRNPNDGVAAGDDGTIRLTSNGGATWYSDPWLNALTSDDIISVAGVDSNTASAITVSNFNGELRSTDTTYILTVSSEQLVGVKDTKNHLPKEFRLFQNYPNPFNPNTKISWQSPFGSHQTLKVYDLLGNEVATLVNEFLPAGAYEAEFDASQLSSGIYFYRFQAIDPGTSSGQGFVETKKMILMK
jgi:hypothetical protein